MCSALATVTDPRLRAGAIMAAPGAWADWFVPYVDAPDSDAYRDGLRDLDPRSLLRGVDKPLLMQFGEHDEFISRAAADDFASVAGDSVVCASTMRAIRSTQELATNVETGSWGQLTGQ